MSNLNIAHLIFILDSSGSMNIIREDTIGGVNALAEDQTAQEGECTMTLVQFNTRVDSIYENKPIGDCEPRTNNNYRPGGGTALLDAIGQTIESEIRKFESLPENERPGLVSLVILTDGAENRSQHYTKTRVRELLASVQDDLNWQVIYLGANQDSFAEAGDFGIDQRMSADWRATGESTRNTMSATSSLLNRTRGATMRGIAPTERKKISYSANELKSMI